MTQSWNDLEEQDLWSLSADEVELLPGMTNMGRLGFAVQLKFMQIHARFPERHTDVDSRVVRWLSTQVGASDETLLGYEFDGRQGRRHRRTIRSVLGFRPVTANDMNELAHWLSENVLPFDPQARHGRDQALDWCHAQRIEPPAENHLDRIVRSALHNFETRLQDLIFERLTLASKTAIDQLLAGDESELDTSGADESAAVSFSMLKTDPGKPSLNSILNGLSKLQCIDQVGADFVARARHQTTDPPG